MEPSRLGEIVNFYSLWQHTFAGDRQSINEAGIRQLINRHIDCHENGAIARQHALPNFDLTNGLCVSPISLINPAENSASPINSLGLQQTPIGVRPQAKLRSLQPLASNRFMTGW